MQKAWKVILILSITANLVLGFILLSKPKIRESNSRVYIEKIDSLELELSLIQQARDSIRGSIDTTIVKIDDNNRDYEKTRDIILSNSITDDYVFFTEYLKWNKERLDSINNP